MTQSRPPAKAPRATPSAARNQLRIIGGKWRGRKLSFAEVPGLRPTGDRIRETLFNWLQADLPESRCLDLFAGSGALGLEALSRGAGSVCFLEQDVGASRLIRQHLQTLKASAAEVVTTDTLQWLAKNGQPMDIIFLDPPFQADLWTRTIDLLRTHNWLQAGTLIYVESPRERLLPFPPEWLLHREKQAGQVTYRLLRVN